MMQLLQLLSKPHHQNKDAHEVWYSENGIGGGQYEVCNGSGEDVQCSSGTLLSGEITDHLTYLRHSVTGCQPFTLTWRAK